MAERSAQTMVAQLGVEATPGANQAANKKLSSVSITGGIKAEIEGFTPAGQKYPAFYVPGREWATWKIAGKVTYGELPYLLSSILKTTTATSDTSNGKKWVFTPALAAEDTVQTYTLEQGSSVRAHKANYFLVTELGFKFTRAGVEYDGAAISQALIDAITLTSATAVENPMVPVLGSQVSVKFADTWAGLDVASALTRVYEVNWKISSRFADLWVLDSSKTSFVAHVEDTPKIAGDVIMQADAAGMAYLDVMRNATRKWMRISATGADIDTGRPFLFQIDGCYQVSGATEFTENQKTTAIGWTFAPVYDATATKTYEVTVRNKLASL